jgi:hypothetical protein
LDIKIYRRKNMPGPAILAGPALATAARYILKHGVKKAVKKYGDDAVKYVQNTKAFQNYQTSKLTPRVEKGATKPIKGDPIKGQKSGEYVEKGMPKASDAHGTLKPPKPEESLKFSKGGRVGYNKGGQPSYKKGEMPKAKPC